MSFDFVDATGLASPDEGHMHSALMEIGDGTLAAAWSWREDGEEQFQEVIRLQRAKVAAK